MTTEERIAQIANNFASGLQNYQQQTDRFRQIEQQDRAAQLAQEARKRQEAIQAIEAANALSRTTGRVIDPAALQPILAGGDLSGFSQLMQSGPETQDVILARQKQAQEEARYNAQMNRQATQDQRQAMLDQLNMENTRSQIQARGKEQTKLKTPTADMRKAATFAQRVGEAENIFTKLSNEGFNRGGYGAGIASTILPGSLQPKNVKIQEQAERNFINSILRRESGAAISPSEFENASLQYFPRAGDPPEVLANKAENRRTALAGLQAEAGDVAIQDIAARSKAKPLPQGAQVNDMSLMSDAVASDPMLQQLKSMSRQDKIKALRGGN